MRSNFLILCSFLAACGGASPPPTEAQAPPTETSVDAPAASAAPTTSPALAAEPSEPVTADPRVSKLAKINKYAYGDDVADDYQRARIIASGLSEEDFGLEEPLVKGLAAVVDSSVDASQCGAILRATQLEVGATHAVGDCADFGALDKQLRSLPQGKRSEAVVKQCKVKLPAAVDLSRVDPWALLVAMSVRQGFQESQELDKIVFGLVYICKSTEAE